MNAPVCGYLDCKKEGIEVLRDGEEWTMHLCTYHARVVRSDMNILDKAKRLFEKLTRKK